MEPLVKQLEEALGHAEHAEKHAGRDVPMLRGIILSMKENIENALRVAGVDDRRGEPRVTLTCGCKSHQFGFPSQWHEQDRQGDDCIIYGQLCERHFYAYKAEPAQYATTA